MAAQGVPERFLLPGKSEKGQGKSLADNVKHEDENDGDRPFEGETRESNERGNNENADENENTSTPAPPPKVPKKETRGRKKKSHLKGDDTLAAASATQ